MSCECSSYDCLEAFVNPCNTGTSLNIVATETATWRARLEFNGMWQEFDLSVTEDEDITILTELFNEDYTHELRLYLASGELFGCYNVKTYYSKNTPDSPITPPLNDVWQWTEPMVNVPSFVNTVTDERFGGDISPIIWVNAQPIEWETAGITVTGTTMNFTAIGGISGNIAFQYKNLPE